MNTLRNLTGAIGKAIKFSSVTAYSTSGGKVSVDGINLNYVTSGDGPQPILCLPGALGSGEIDFKCQLEESPSGGGLDREKFTLIAWDPPGYGKSRPPERRFSKKFLEEDAEISLSFMRRLGHEKFSLLGWSDGGITAMYVAGKYPTSISSMVVFGANAYICDEDIQMIEKVADVSQWSERMKKPMEEMYGKDGFPEIWKGWVNAYKMIHDSGGDFCKTFLPNIRCPTLIIHGAKDVMVAPEHPTYMKEHIKDSELLVFDEGKHNLHMKHKEEFNQIVNDFFVKNISV